MPSIRWRPAATFPAPLPSDSTSSAPSAAIASKLLRSGTKFHPLFSDMFFSKNQKNCSSRTNSFKGWVGLMIFVFLLVWRLLSTKISSRRFFSFRENFENNKKKVFSWDLEFETNPQLLSFLVGYLCWQKCLRNRKTPLRNLWVRVSYVIISEGQYWTVIPLKCLKLEKKTRLFHPAPQKKNDLHVELTNTNPHPQRCAAQRAHLFFGSKKNNTPFRPFRNRAAMLEKLQFELAVLHPWRLIWNIIMEVWKIIFLSKWVICRFHVNLPGCMFFFVLVLDWNKYQSPKQNKKNVIYKLSPCPNCTWKPWGN